MRVTMANFSTGKSITFLDIETSNLDPSKSTILQISFITDWENGNQTAWTTNIKPSNLELNFASEESLKICNYSSEEWESAPTFPEVAAKIAEKLMWGPLVGHNINFDLSHIRSVFKRYKWEESNNIDLKLKQKKYKIGYPIVDTCALAYLFLPTEKQNLHDLRDYFKITHEGSHDSLKDTQDCREIFYQIVSKYLE
jgi:DNA polymerase III epsilon subunit-like protein